MSQFIEAIGENTYNVNCHWGQARLLQSRARYPVVCAGSQGGKTCVLPLALAMEIERCGPGDYIAASATYDIFQLKLLPEMSALFTELLGWEYSAGSRIFWKRKHGQKWRILLRSMETPRGLESCTAKAAIADEPGQIEIPRTAHEALKRRLRIHQGRIFYGTTLYAASGWFVSDVIKPAMAQDPRFELINFPSWWNPLFPMEEYWQAKREMPEWKFDLFHRGVLTKPTSLIYKDFRDWRRNVKEAEGYGQRVWPFKIPEHWKRTIGVDFGSVNTAIVWIAENTDYNAETLTKSPYHEGPESQYYVYRYSLGGGLTQAEWARKTLEYGERIAAAWGGSGSEDAHRLHWQMGGVGMLRPLVTDVEGGIDKVVGLFRTDRLAIFDHLHSLVADILNYCRELDESGNPTMKIEDKQSHHGCDALRYGCSAYPLFPKDYQKQEEAPASERARAVWEVRRKVDLDRAHEEMEPPWEYAD